jgi:hypothetical protein
MDECIGSDYRAGFYRSDPSQTYDRFVTTIARNGRYALVPSNVVLSPPFTMTPAKAVQRTSKRKHENTVNYQPSYVESCLVQLCRGKRWMEVVHRCHYYPEEACLVPIRSDLPGKVNAFHRHSRKRDSIQSIHGEDDNPTLPTPLFRETALGIICSSKSIGTEEAKLAILALVHANPGQVGASQYIPGHTPLRDAILNDRCTIGILQLLTEAKSRYRGWDLALHQRDRNGLSPMDHLVISVQLGSSLDSIDMLKAFLRLKKLVCAAPSLEDHSSPLIRLLTMGNAFHSSPSPKEVRESSWEQQPKDSDNDVLQLQRVLHATRLLLDDDPDLLVWCSKVTKCTPLHVALRNYGNFAPLIEELLERDTSGKMIQLRNCYGDLPIHVACSVGVPFEILGLVVEKTVLVAINATTNRLTVNDGRRVVGGCEQHSLILSANKSGYTPVDLEWICHIESGQGLYTARPFSPSESPEVRQHCFKQDAYYRDLLKESVDQVTKGRDSVRKDDKPKSGAESRKKEAEMVFGDLLDRISLLIGAAAAAATVESDFAANENCSAKLVESSKLGTPYSSSLPLPILELFLWLRPEEVTEKDQQDFLPIHHALRYGTTTFGCGDSPTTALSPNAIHDWKSFIFQLLGKSSEQCRAKSREGRLPLHYALDHSVSSIDSRSTPPSNTTSATRNALQSSRHAIVEKLVDLYPGSVDQKDPITGLYPFMMASMDKTLPLNTVFCLLRRSPSRCPAAVKA